MKPSVASGVSSAPYDPRRLVKIHAERISDVSSTDFPGHHPSEDDSWNLTKFTNKLQVSVQRLSNRSIEFDLIGVDASIANALRRILIAEVPTICVENVYVWNNTTMIADEVLAHRIGLVPLNVDPSTLLMKSSEAEQPTDRNTLVFKISLACVRKPRRPKPTPTTAPAESPAMVDPSELYDGHELLSSHITWEPQGEQAAVFAHHPPGPTNPRIVLAKLRPGQEVDIECHAVKGVGMDHAKFSPVATASYRLLPTITLVPSRPVPPHLAHKFASCFPPGIISVDPRTKTVSVNEREVRRDPVTREVLRHAEFNGCVELGRVRDHFLFNIESESAYEPQDLLPAAISVMRDKIAAIRRSAEALLGGQDDPVEMGNA